VGDEFYGARRTRWRIVRILVDPKRERRPGEIDAVFVVEPA
jgi:hypothetical protein